MLPSIKRSSVLKRILRTFFPKLPPTVWVLFVACVVNRMGTMVLPFLTLYMTRGLGFSAKEAGMALAVYGFGSIFAGPLSGWASDRFGTVRVMLFSLFSSSIVMFIFPWADSYAEILLMSLMFSITNELHRPAIFTLTSQLTDSNLRRQAFAVVRVAVNIGMSIGPMIGGILVTHSSFRSIFMVDAVTTIAAALIVWYAFVHRQMVGGTALQGAGKDEPMPKFWASLSDSITNPVFRIFWLAMFLNSIVFFQFESTMPLIVVKDLGLTEQLYGFSFTINTLMIIFLEIPLTNWLQKFDILKVMAVGAAFIGLGFAGMAFISTAIGFCVTVAVWTIGEMVLFPASSAFVSENAPKSRVGAYMGTFSTSFNLAHIVGPLAGTWIWETWGTNWLCVFCVAVGVPSAIMFLYKRPLQTKLSPQQ
jgi:MFS family permease